MTLIERRNLYLEHQHATPARQAEITAELEADTTLHVTLIEIDDRPLTPNLVPGTV